MTTELEIPAPEAQRAALPARPAPKRKLLPLAVTLLLVAVAAGATIRHLGFPAGAAPAPAAPLPTPVTVETVKAQKTRLWSSFSGRLKAVDAAEIRPEVSGRITEVRFQDGQSVKAGDILFVIDPRPFAAAVDRAQARVASAAARLQLTVADQTRNNALLHSGVIAKREFDQTDSANSSASAELLAAKADLKTAAIDLDHAYVKAPIAGRVSRAEITIGNFVESGAAAPVLTSIVSKDGIYADFEVDEQTYLATIRDAANGNAQEGTIPVELVVPGGAERIHKGFVQNFDNRLDSGSGTIRARARFENPDLALVPGMFVSVRLASSQEKALILLDDLAIGFDQSKTTVLTVDAANKVAYREIELGAPLVGKHVVLEGLQDGDRVIVNGVQRVVPGAVVAPSEYDPVAQASAVPTTYPVKED